MLLIFLHMEVPSLAVLCGWKPHHLRNKLMRNLSSWFTPWCLLHYLRNLQGIEKSAIWRKNFQNMLQKYPLVPEKSNSQERKQFVVFLTRSALVFFGFWAFWFSFVLYMNWAATNIARRPAAFHLRDSSHFLDGYAFSFADFFMCKQRWFALWKKRERML